MPVTLCGELGGKPLSALALVAIGFRHLSMSASSLGPVKAMLLGLDGRRRHRLCRGNSWRWGTARASLRPELAAYAERHSLPL